MASPTFPEFTFDFAVSQSSVIPVWDWLLCCSMLVPFPLRSSETLSSISWFKKTFLTSIHAHLLPCSTFLGEKRIQNKPGLARNVVKFSFRLLSCDSFCVYWHRLWGIGLSEEFLIGAHLFCLIQFYLQIQYFEENPRILRGLQWKFHF